MDDCGGGDARGEREGETKSDAHCRDWNKSGNAAAAAAAAT